MWQTLLESACRNQNLIVYSTFSESGALSPWPAFGRAVSAIDQEGLSFVQGRHEAESISSGEFAKMYDWHSGAR